MSALPAAKFPQRHTFASLSLLLLAGVSMSAHAAASQSAITPEKAAAQTDEQIVVKAKRRNQMEVTSGGQLGALGNKRGLDVPFNIRSYNSSLILNQQSQTLGEVLENDPSVRTTYGYGNFSEMFVIRGFVLNGDDIAINGLYGITPRQLVSPQPYDQVQVLNGASAFLNGAAPSGSAIGGNINLMFKHATNAPITRLTGDYTSSAMGGAALMLAVVSDRKRTLVCALTSQACPVKTQSITNTVILRFLVRISTGTTAATARAFHWT